jgi:D-glycero-alpha-D-manno-heptose-7-phosphate kinase
MMQARRTSARAWCRVDLAGGTLDIWPIGVLHSSSRTVNVAIDLAVEVELSPSPDSYVVIQGESMVEADSAEGLVASEESALVGLIVGELELPSVEIRVRSASPRGGGLGASSALAVALIAASESYLGRPASGAAQRSALARDLEARLMGLPTGTQDHYPALLGGVLEVEHRAGGERVRRLDVDLDLLAESLVVAYTGQSHFSAGNNWKIVRRRLDGDPETMELFDGIRDVTVELPAVLEAGDLEEAGRLMSREWSYRRRLAEGVSTPVIESLLERSVAAGAWGGKVCGAGGGGSIALLAPPERRQVVVEALTEGGAQVLPARPTDGELRVESVSPAQPVPGG